jgi:oligoribonuclease NrnB/cAMP/cGMP phosphodiesterase (DHH superfamily)
MDGSACAICFQLGGGLKHNIHFANPQHESTDEILSDLLSTGVNNIILADVSISEKMADKVDQSGANVLLFDHHKSAIPLANRPWCTIEKENNACGSKMLFQNLMDKNKEYPDVIKYYSKWKELIDLVDDYDRWVRNYPESEDLALLHPMIGQSMFIDRFLTHPTKDLTSEERYVINLEKRKMEEEISEKKRVVQSSIFKKKINGKEYRLGIITGVKYISTTGDALYSDPQLNLDCVVMITGATISMRSSKACELDLSKIAKDNGGGGHKSASGFPLRALLGMDLPQFVAEKMKLL